MKKLITVKLTHDEIMEIINLITVRGLGAGLEPEHRSEGKKLRKLKDQLDKLEEKEDEILSNIDEAIDELEEENND